MFQSKAKRRGELTWIELEAFLAEASEERQAFLTEGEDLGIEVVDLRFELHEREMVRRSGSAGALGRRILAGGGGRRVLPLGDRGGGHGCCCDEGEHQRGARASLERWRAAPEFRRRAILKEPRLPTSLLDNTLPGISRLSHQYRNVSSRYRDSNKHVSGFECLSWE